MLRGGELRGDLAGSPLFVVKTSKKTYYKNHMIVYYGFHGGKDGDKNSINCFEMVRDYASERGEEFYFYPFLDSINLNGEINRLKNASLVVMWGDTQYMGQTITDICFRRDIPIVYIEWGMLPQSQNFFVDSSGLLGNSILAKDLSWVNDEDVSSMLVKRKELQQEYKVDPQGYIFVPLQLENDTSILHHSHYNSMNEFLEYVEYLFPNNRIIVKTHPKQESTETAKERTFGDVRGVKRQLRPPQLPILKERFKKMEFLTEGNILEIASKADLIVGISSTCLYECGILGVPVLPLGDHPLRMHKKEYYDKVLAGALALNFPRTSKLEPILKKLNIKPL